MSNDSRFPASSESSAQRTPVRRFSRVGASALAATLVAGSTLGLAALPTAQAETTPAAVVAPANVGIQAATDPAYGWGQNFTGQLGDGTTSSTDDSVPVTVSTNEDFVQISAGGVVTVPNAYASACAIDTNQDLWCWGYNAYGQLGLGDTTNRSVPTQVTSPATTWSSVSLGNNHACAVTTTGLVYCWGTNDSGQLGTDDTVSSTTPVQVVTGEQGAVGGKLEDISTVSASGYAGKTGHTCATTLTTQNVYCWGRNDSGEMGQGTSGGLTKSPVKVHGIGNTGFLGDAISVSAGFGNACAVISGASTASNTVNCWGFGSEGVLGNGSATSQYSPVVVVSTTGSGTLTGIIQVARGYSRTTCAAKYDGAAYCWGSGGMGSLGNGTTPVSQTSPVQVLSGEQPALGSTLEDVAQVDVGNQNACARTSGGAVYCWGKNNSGQLGNGVIIPDGPGGETTTPVRVLAGTQSATPGAFLENATFISVGNESTYAATAGTPTSPTPTFDTPVSTLDGFTVNVTNYDDSYTWTPSVTTGTVVAGTASGSTLPLVVTGLAAGTDDTITVTTTRSGYTNGSATVMGSALEAALTPTFDTPVSTSTGYTVNVTNYDDSYTWTPSVSSGSVSAGTASGSTLPLTITSLSPGASATTTVATTRTGYAPGQAQVIGVALIPRASASPTSVNFGVQTVGSPSAAQTITVTSTGTDDLTFGGSAVTITGADSAMFSDDTDTCSGQTVTPSNTCTIEVTFTPTSTGAKSATLSIASNDPASPTTIALSGGQNPTPPTPPTPTKPSAPTNVSGTAGDGQVSVTWQAPADSGTYAITDYQVTASPGGATCMTTAPTLACTIDGLTNGTAYTFTVKALSGAGWGADSAPSAPVTPQAPRNPTITITGSRSQDNDKRVYADGITTDLAGEQVQARVHLAGEEEYQDGSRRTVSEDGTFRWQRKTNKKVYIYFRHDETRSNRIVISPR